MLIRRPLALIGANHYNGNTVELADTRLAMCCLTSSVIRRCHCGYRYSNHRSLPAPNRQKTSTRSNSLRVYA